MKETDWNVHCFWLQNNRRVKKIDLPLIPPLETTIMKIFSPLFYFPWRKRFHFYVTDASTYKCTYVCICTHARIHRSSHSLTHPPPSHSYISHTLSLSSQPNKGTHSYKCTHPRTHLSQTRLPLTGTETLIHLYNILICIHTHTQTASHTGTTLFHIQLPTIDNLTHIPPQIHLCTLTPGLSQNASTPPSHNSHIHAH